MARSAGKPARGHMSGHAEAKVRGPRKTGKKGAGKPKNYNAKGYHSKMYAGGK